MLVPDLEKAMEEACALLDLDEQRSIISEQRRIDRLSEKYMASTSPKAGAEYLIASGKEKPDILWNRS